MQTLLEYTNELDALQKRLETDIAQREAQIAALKAENTKLHNGMARKISALQKVVAKAAEANAKSDIKK